MKRSCFALSILMASLSGSLLWVDAARSSNGASPAHVAVDPREAVPRPPRVPKECCSDNSDSVCSAPETKENFLACEEPCPQEACPYSLCPYDGCFYAEETIAHPADLPEAMQEEASAEVVSVECAEACETTAALDPRNLSQHDSVYDEAVYGVEREAPIVEVAVESELAVSHQEPDFCQDDAACDASAATVAQVDREPCHDENSFLAEVYGYQAYTDEYAAKGDDLEDVGTEAAENAAKEASDYAAEYGFTYEYEDEAKTEESVEADSAAESYEYEYEYDYRYEYDYDYEYDGYEPPAEEAPIPVAPEANLVEGDESATPGDMQPGNADYRIVAAHLRDLLKNSVDQCEPIRAAIEAGCTIVTWGSGIDAAVALEAATAQIADLPPGENLPLLRR